MRAALLHSPGWAQAQGQSVELLLQAGAAGRRLLGRRGQAGQGLLEHAATNASALSRPPPTSAAAAAAAEAKAAAEAAAAVAAAATALQAVPTSKPFDDFSRAAPPASEGVLGGAWAPEQRHASSNGCNGANGVSGAPAHDVPADLANGAPTGADAGAAKQASSPELHGPLGPLGPLGS